MGKSPLLFVSVIVMAIACGVMGTLLLMRPTEVGRLPTPPTTIAPAPSLVLPVGASSQVKEPVDAPPPIVAAPAATGAIAALGVPPPVVAPPKQQSATDAAKVYTVRVIARTSQGTGFAIAPNLIVTSHHIVGVDRFVTLTLHDKTSVKAEVIATEALTDCALIYSPRRIAGVAQVESSASTSVGTEIFVYGHPEGLDGTLSNGIISGLRSAADESLAAIQITAPISHGSSGSPLFLHDGKVIGLIQATITDGQNLNFALPIAKVLGSFARVMESWKKLGEVRTELALIEPGRDITRIRALMGRVDSLAARINDSTLMNECRLIGWAHENVSSELSTIDLVGDLVKRVVAARLSSADGRLPEADLAVFKKELSSLSKYGLRGPLLAHMDDSVVNAEIFEFNSIRTPDSVTALVADVRGSGGLKRDRLLAVYRDILSNQPQARDCLLFAHLLHPVEVEAAIGKGPIEETWTRALATQYTQPLCGFEYASGPRVLSKCLGWLPIKDAKDYYLAVEALNKRIIASHGNPVQTLNELGFLQEFGIGTPINYIASADSYRGGALYGNFLPVSALARIAITSTDPGVRSRLLKNISAFLSTGVQPVTADGRLTAAQMIALGMGPQLRMDDIYSLLRSDTQNQHTDQFVRADAKRIISHLSVLSHPESCLQVGFERYNTGNKPDALQLFRRAAAGGEASAASQLGYMYAIGDGVAKDEGQARVYTQLAADLGNLTGLYNLGLDLIKEKKVKEGTALIERAADNLPTASIWMARNTYRQNDVASEIKSKAYLLNAYLGGDVDACAITFRMLTAVPPTEFPGADPAKVLSWLTYHAATGSDECLAEYKKLVEGDSPAARAAKPLYEIHLMRKSRDGKSSKTDRARNLTRLVDEARNDNPFALQSTYDLVNGSYDEADRRVRGGLLPLCAKKFPKLYSSEYADDLLDQISESDLITKSPATLDAFGRVVKILETGANAGDAAAKVKLSLILEYGMMGVPHDHRRAVDLLVAAGQDGDLDALKMLTFASIAGDLLPRDLEKALGYWRQVIKKVPDYEFAGAVGRLALINPEKPALAEGEERKEIDLSHLSVERDLRDGDASKKEMAAIGLVLSGRLSSNDFQHSSAVQVCTALGDWPYQKSALAFHSDRQAVSVMTSNFAITKSLSFIKNQQSAKFVLRSMKLFRMGSENSFLAQAIAQFAGLGVAAEQAGAYAVMARMSDRGEPLAKLYALQLKSYIAGNVDRSVGEVRTMLRGPDFRSILYDNGEERARADYLDACGALQEGDLRAAAIGFQRSASAKNGLAALSALMLKAESVTDVLTPEFRAQTLRSLVESISRGSSNEPFSINRPRFAVLPALTNLLLKDALRLLPSRTGTSEDQFLRSLTALLASNDPQLTTEAHDSLRSLSESYDPAAIVLGGLYYRGFTMTADASLGEALFTRVKSRSPGAYDALIKDILSAKPNRPRN